MIRFLSDADLEKIINLQNECDFFDGWSKQNFSSSFLRKDFFVLGDIDNGKLLGYIAYTVCIDTADLELILVDKNFREQGIGNKLLLSALNKMKEKGVIRALLEVRRDNEIALSFYLNNGFKKINVRKKYYRDGTDALILAKELV